ncbi:synaptic vesicle glycoprotein 2B-like isoform X2 [Tenebrio molitor]|uniref:synaptic vesicle glycoprotein 2B-like isoform X2 n=1 Tax=Tenebrio molitor TaxID=7067 RepID=UPI0036247357
MTKKYRVTSVFVVSPRIAEKEKLSEPADFETAISATKFGKYNLLLILIAIPAGWSSIFETTTMSYVFPAAQCDLDLSLDDKGLLNAVTYLGMISSALIWGFLFDTLGRKKLLIIGFILDAIFVIMSWFSQTKILLMVSKFLGGFIINGPFAALTTYISEFHCAKYRARMQLVLGTIFSCGSVVLPLLAWLILPQNFYFSAFNKSLEFHSWNLYLLICGLPSLTSAIIFIFMPESPKFLMTVGHNDKALKVFQKVYSLNTGNPAHTYPITHLVNEIELNKNNPNTHGGQVTANRTKIQALKEGWQQMKPLFFPPHLANIILVCLIQTLFTMSLNTLRLWLPQIFQAINDYQYFHNESSAGLCEMLQMIKPATKSDECVVNLNNSSVYINSITVASVSMFSYFFAGYLINILGKKKLMNILGIISGLCACSMYFSTNSAMVVSLSSLFIASASVATNVVLTVIIDLFPTTLRTMTVSLAMMLARSGAMMGNLIFPLLLRAGCAPPFFSVGSVILGCAFLALLLPNTDLKALE